MRRKRNRLKNASTENALNMYRLAPKVKQKVDLGQKEGIKSGKKLIKRKEAATHSTIAAGGPHRFHIRPCTLHMTFMDNT